MKTKQVNPMPAFVKGGFDCHFKKVLEMCLEVHWVVSPLMAVRQLTAYGQTISLFDGEGELTSTHCRPRLNKPQALPDWGWLDNPLLDGFVWEVRWFNDIAEMLYTDRVDSKKCFEIATHPLHDFLHAEIKGAQKGSQLEDWAIENDVPIYNDDMEVVK